MRQTDPAELTQKHNLDPETVECHSALSKEPSRLSETSCKLTETLHGESWSQGGRFQSGIDNLLQYLGDEGEVGHRSIVFQCIRIESRLL